MQVLQATQLSAHGVRHTRGPRARCAHRARDPRAHSGHARGRNANGHARQPDSTARARTPAQTPHEVHVAAVHGQ